MSQSALSARDVVEVLELFSEALSTHRESINALNVFPVPDGDTGTNMAATVSAAHEAVTELGPEPGLEQVCQAIAKGSLMGARGNSGVILCQILRGLTGEFASVDPVGASSLVAGLEQAALGARAAVLRPVEGTILSVASAASSAASALGSGASLAEVARAARDGSVAALAITPSQLPVLAEAGVVDSGGTGLVLLFEAFYAVSSGEPMADKLALPESVASLIATARPTGLVRVGAEELDGLAYEVMYLLQANDAAVPAFKAHWGEIGDSIVVVGSDGLWNCHIHTNDIGAAIEAGIAVGTPSRIRVTDLRLEVVAEEEWVRAASGVTEPEGSDGLAQSAVIAVSSGEGIARIFSSLGVARIVAGGQSMNPSTKELLAVIESLGAREVIVLPNNANIIPVARQLDALSDKQIAVVETRSVQEGLAALLDFDPGSSAIDNAERMGLAANRVVAGEVTQAVRSASSPVGSVNAGDWIGLAPHGIAAVASSMGEATCGLLESLLQAEHEIVTLIEGASCSAPEVERVVAYLAERHPHVSVERLYGGQPLYPLLVSIE